MKKPASDVEAAEVGAIEETTLTFDPDPHFARGDCRDAMLGVVRSSMDWGKLDEQRQRDVNAAIDVAASTIVSKLVKALAAEGRATVVGKLEQLTVKDGIAVKLTCGFTHDNLALLGDAAGKTVQIVMADAAAHDHQRAPARVDLDQPELPVGDEQSGDLVDQPDEHDPGGHEGQTVRDVEIRDSVDA